MCNRFVYEEPGILSKEETLRILNGETTVKQKVMAILGAVNSIDDPDWLQELCLGYANHEDRNIAGTAINSLGDIAKINRKLDVKPVLKKLNAIKLQRKELRGQIGDAIDDINDFMINPEPLLGSYKDDSAPPKSLGSPA